MLVCPFASFCALVRNEDIHFVWHRPIASSKHYNVLPANSELQFYYFSTFCEFNFRVPSAVISGLIFGFGTVGLKLGLEDVVFCCPQYYIEHRYSVGGGLS